MFIGLDQPGRLILQTWFQVYFQTSNKVHLYLQQPRSSVYIIILPGHLRGGHNMHERT